MAYLAWVKDNPRYIPKVFANGAQHAVPYSRYPTARGCALFCGVARSTWYTWKEEGHRLKETIEWAEDMFAQENLEGAMTGEYNAAIVARHLGLKEQSEVDTTLKVEVVDRFGADGSHSPNPNPKLQKNNKETKALCARWQQKIGRQSP